MASGKLSTLFLILVAAYSSSGLSAEPIAVRQTLGVTRGFLVVRSEEGRIIAHGDLNQVAHGNRITARLVYRFLDGSIDEDTTTYTQQGTFRLVRDHHIQKGPYFPKPADYLVDVPSGNVTSRSMEKDGKEKIEVEHMDLPSDVSNGLVGAIFLNVPASTPEFKVSMVAPVGKGRLVKLAISPSGRGDVNIMGVPHKANIFRIKVELGGVTGVVAPIIGKHPADVFVWVVPGDAPGLIREVAQLYNEGPLVSIELAGASFPKVGSGGH